MNYLIISNGYGEDQIACNLIQSIQSKQTNATFKVIPFVGKGLAYKKIGLTPIIKNDELPSGGFIRNIRDLLSDIKQGLLTKHLLKQLKSVRDTSKHTDITISVGDVWCLILSKLSNKNPVYFLPTAKSDHFMPHSKIEYWLIKRFSKAIFTRDEITAISLKRHRCNAHYLGNPMCDNIFWSENMLGFNKEDFIIGILPGSRQEAIENLIKILDVTQHIYKLSSKYKFCLSLAPQISQSKLDEKLKMTDWIRNENKLTHPSGCKVTISMSFGDVLGISKAIIGLAGTANEQAVYSGRPVFCFEGTGPQSTSLRFDEQSKLLGKKLIFLKNKHTKILAKYIVLDLKRLSLPKSPGFISQEKASNKIIDYIIRQ